MNRTLVLSAALVLLTACRPSTTPGAIEGTITLQGTPPPPQPLDTTMDPNCNSSAGAPPPVSEQYVVHSHHLANVFLTIQSAPAIPAPPQNKAIIDQKNCVYTPHIAAIPAGSTVEFHNSDPGMHNIETFPTVPGNQRLDTSQGPHGTPRTATFPHPETMIPVRCAMHPWMSAYINVAPTPYFAISDPEGHFRIPNLPPGDYTLLAAHEVLGQQTLHLTVKPHQTTQSNFTFTIR